MTYKLLPASFLRQEYRLVLILPVCIVLILLSCLSVEGQLKADFTVDSATEACSGLPVRFVDQSQGNPTKWTWTFGDGGTPVTEQNPSRIFNNPGDYTITLVVENSAGDRDTMVREAYIKVYAEPHVSFSASSVFGCSPFRVHFTDQSAVEDGAIKSWLWDFGDGNTSTDRNPDYTYEKAGSPGVSLVVTSDKGCQGSSAEQKTITVQEGVNANFTADQLSTCGSTMKVQFTASTNGTKPVTYRWDFGDNQPGGTGPAPFHTYTQPGDYTVRLIASPSAGCADTVIKENLIRVASFHSDFKPTGVCTGTPVTFENTSAPSPGHAAWFFDDVPGSRAINAVHQFAKAGDYKVKLVNYYGDCTDTVVKTVTASPPPKADFSFTPEPACGKPTHVTFDNKSDGNASYLWDFGDGSGVSVDPEPAYDYTTGGNYVIKLTVKNKDGCEATAQHTAAVKVLDPEINISASRTRGCTPLTIHFQSAVNNAGPGATYLWDFGDHTTSTEENPVHPFTKKGHYTVKLKVTTAGNCTDSLVREDFIQVADSPKVDFSVLPAQVVCMNTPVQFTGGGGSPGISWEWDFPDDGATAEYGENPSHQFSYLGKQDVVLTVDDNGCEVKTTKKGFITVQPPVAAFGVSRSCTDPYTMTFTDGSVEAAGWEWDFGDGKKSDKQNPPPHHYEKPGTYTVTLQTHAGECSSDASMTIHIIDLHPVLKVSADTVCHGTPVSFSPGNNSDAQWVSYYTWDPGNGDTYTSYGPDFSLSYSTNGTYNTRLITVDLNGCTDTSAVVPLTVRGPLADFQLSSPGNCKGESVTFRDKSIANGAPILRREWYFGDGTRQTLSEDSAVYTYKQDGQYDVGLKVFDQNGCSNGILREGAVSVFSAKADFTTADKPTCPGSPVYWVNESAGNRLTYQWNFGDSTGSSEENPVKHYRKEGTYSVSLKVKTDIGCTDSVLKEQYIRVAEPRAAWKYSDNDVTCPPFIITVVNQSENYSRILWDFGDGSTSDNTGEVIHIYTMGGTYRLRMLVYGLGDGCVDSFVKIIKVDGPSGTAHVTDSIGCSPHGVQFSATSANAFSYQWDFGDGNVSDPAVDGKVTHPYKHGGIYQPKLFLFDRKNCKVIIPTRSKVKIDEIDITPSAALPEICDSSLQEFQLGGSIYTKDSLGLPVVYQWDFGDPGPADNTSASATPRHRYTVPRDYTAHVRVKTVYGCDVEKTVAVTVPKPYVMRVTASPDTTICRGTAAALHATGAYRYAWTPAAGTDDASSDAPTVKPGATTTYRVIGYAGGDCQVDTAYTTVTVADLPDAVVSTADTLICPGSPVSWVNGSAGDRLTYQWNFGDGTSSSDETPAKSYRDEGIYTVSLKVRSAVGCLDSVVKTDYIRAGEPHARWNYADSNTNCLPLVVSIQNRSENYRKILWDFGDGTTSQDTGKVRHAYDVPGTYRLRMLVYGFSNGCMDSLVKMVEVKGPYGAPKIADSIGCSPYEVPFSAVATNTVSYQWNFGDGAVSDPAATDKITHTYLHSGIFQPSLTLTDRGGCRVTILAGHRIKVDEIHITPSAAFPDICDSSIQQFQVSGTIFTKDSMNLPVNYQWHFGEPASTDNGSMAESPRHNYNAAGEYQANVTVGTAYGCTAREAVNVTIPPPYILKVSAYPDTTICKGDAVILHASGAVRYVWAPADGLNNTASAAPAARPDITTIYQVTGYSTGDCQVDTARVQVVVKNLPGITLPQDTTVGTGSSFLLPVSYTPDAVTWSWAPNQYLDCIQCATPVSSPHSPITYRVVTANQWGCSDTASIAVRLICKEGKVFIPNTFTPNGDGLNEIFYPRGKGVSEVIYFYIYNRWGQLIYSHSHFQLNDISSGWKGTFKGQKLDPGVYIYQTSMRCESGDIFQLNGNITLLR